MKIAQLCPCPLCSGLAARPSRRQAGLAVDTNTLDIHDVTVPVPHLPRHLEGLTIAHLTDMHLRRLGPLEERVLAAVQARDPAVVVLTGDMLSSRKALPLLAEFCRGLTAPGRQVLAIRGNHEVRAQIPVTDLQRLYRQAGARLLVNEHVALDAAFTIVGTEDSLTKHYDLHTALWELPAAPVRIHLSHAPEVFDWPHEPAVSFALCLASHTHGGQMRFPFLPPYVPAGTGPRFVAGWYPHTKMGPAYVSRGIGTVHIPLRLNCPPELPFLHLARA
jgi:uncharacterized protein